MNRSVAACVFVVALLLLAAPSPAWAYVGPGSGLTAIGAALAFVGGILLAIVGFVWYPIKRILNLGRSRKVPTGE